MDQVSVFGLSVTLLVTFSVYRLRQFKNEITQSEHSYELRNRNPLTNASRAEKGNSYAMGFPRNSGMTIASNPNGPGLKRPPRLRPGDEVAIVAPGSPLKPDERETVKKSLRVLEHWGLRPVMAPDLWEDRGYLAGTDEQRAEQIRWAFSQDRIRGVFCLRGGYGSLRLLPGLEGEAFRWHPKILVGFSDLTALLLFLLQTGRMVCFHGPTLSCEDLARGPQSPSAISLYRVTIEGKIPEAIAGETLAGGAAEGPLSGGCLSIISSLQGTGFAPKLGGAVCFLEDVNEPLYRMDRMLSQLRLSGSLDDTRGFVFGAMQGSYGKNEFRDMVLDVLGPLNVPILFGVPSGHGESNLTLPLGVRVRLDADRGMISFLEHAVNDEID